MTKDLIELSNLVKEVDPLNLCKEEKIIFFYCSRFCNLAAPAPSLARAVVGLSMYVDLVSSFLFVFSISEGWTYLDIISLPPWIFSMLAVEEMNVW